MKRLSIFIVIGFILVGCGGKGSSGQGGGSGGNNTTIPSSGIYDANDSEQVKYLKVINYARSIARTCVSPDGSKTEGFFSAAPPLVHNDALYDAAFEHNHDMIANNVFQHEGTGTSYDTTGYSIASGHKSTFVERIEANGYGAYLNIGENLAFGQISIETAVKSWLESPGHCANLMSSDYTQTGISREEDNSAAHRVYWTQEFGRPAS